jgi:saccharopine dehydrogenase-like NADP-dependent oxidoreductase
MITHSPHKLLTAIQEELLMECHECELMKMDPCLGPHHMKHIKALVRLGLVAPKNFIKDGKNLLRFFITPSGKQYLKQATALE